MSPEAEKDIVKKFHRLYFDSHRFGKTWGDTFWLGAVTKKCPLDMWVYQEIIHELRPDVIVECGTALGGSALFMATICDLIGNGKIVTIDTKKTPNLPKHKRIKYLVGSSTSKEVLNQVKDMIKKRDKVMVILDSAHNRDHVFNELQLYNNLVTKGSYLIVEDTQLNGHPVYPKYGPGPMEALNDFLKVNNDFMIDKSKEKFYMTFNPRGYLKKVR
ncbi:cephalosporin hydroxylase [Candidatus Pacearchaeota archaeon CG1_02_39_14]|nr:MAG: cephalosporin hydroxylase [Candidatus Pacearchaeota archaeon CG1_02_39_14]